jgi:ariadne-1
MQAHRQVVECRRILKWTYAYGYYRFDTIPLEQDIAEQDGEDDGEARPQLTKEERAKAREQLKEMKNRKEFFEFLQGDAETALERLSDALEKDLTRYNSREEFWREKGMHRIVVMPLPSRFR